MNSIEMEPKEKSINEDFDEILRHNKRMVNGVAGVLCLIASILIKKLLWP